MGLTLGQKVRSLRQQLGLSQQQLGGTELTRAFISLVEQDKCQPSRQTLQLIAARLGKPVEYFLDTSEDPDLEAAVLLQEAAQRALQTGELREAHRLASSAVQMADRVSNTAVGARARRLLADTLTARKEWQAAIEVLEDLADVHRKSGDSAALADIHLQIGLCYDVLEQYATARRHLHRTIQLARGKKRLAELQIIALATLGRCEGLTGHLESSITAYKSAAELAAAAGLPDWAARCTYSLGFMCLKAGQLDQAHRYAQAAVQMYEPMKNPGLAASRHNLALVKIEMGRWQEALPILQQSLEGFRATGLIHPQARIMRLLARYWIHMGDLNRAERLCEEALETLNLEDDGITRGQVYRTLGQIYALRKNPQRARELLQISVEILRRIQAADELAKTQALIANLSAETDLTKSAS